MTEEIAAGSDVPHGEPNAERLKPDGRVAQLGGSPETANFDIRLRAITSELQSGGPEVSLEWLVGYIDGTLDPGERQQVGRNIVTWKAWYEAYWEMLVAEENSDGAAKT